MADDGDLHEQILHIEAQLEELTDTVEACRKMILISKAAISRPPLPAAKMGSSHYPVCPKPAITLSRKDWHSAANRAVLVTVPRRNAPSGSCPAGCVAEVG